MKINFLKALWGTKHEQEKMGDKKAPAPAARDSMGTSKASREQKRQKKARRITRRNT